MREEFAELPQRRSGVRPGAIQHDRERRPRALVERREERRLAALVGAVHFGQLHPLEGVDDAAAADGGETESRDAAPQYKQAVAETVRDASEPVGMAYIIQHTEGSPDALRDAIDAALKKGLITEEADDSYRAD